MSNQAFMRSNYDSQRTDRDEFITNYYPHINFLASRMAARLPANVMVDDLVNAGAIGLMDAMDKFDPEMGVRFQTYAEFRIKGAMLDELRNMDWLHRSIRKKATMLQKGMERAQMKLGRSATEEEVAGELGMDIEEYSRMLRDVSSISVISIEDLAIDDNGERNIWNIISDKEAPDPIEKLGLEELRDAMAVAIKSLPEKERLVITLYYYEELAMKEIGSIMKVTESRISQLHSQAVMRLKLKLAKYMTA
ncbi:MAG: FliA/WhiG family RNA polymerase sigma factor [Nitrospirota bacterium]